MVLLLSTTEMSKPKTIRAFGPAPPFGQKSMKIKKKTRYNNVFVFSGSHDPGCGQSRTKFTKVDFITVKIMKIFG